MNENTENTQEQQPVEETPVADVGAEVSVPEALRTVDPAKLAEVRAKLAAFMAKRGTTVSGAEDPDSPVVTEGVQQMGGTEGANPMGETMTGKDVDWDEYDLDYSVRHLYPRAIFRDTPQGPKWVATLDEFYSTERAAKQHGKQVNAPGSTDKNETESLNLGEYLTQMVNGPDGWAIAATLPGTSGNAIVILRKGTNVVLPDPSPLKKMEEVEAPKDQELASIEDAALDFAAEEGLTPPALVEDDARGESTGEPTPEEIAAKEEALAADFARRALGRGQVEVEEGTGALPARDNDLIRRAIDRNRGESVPALAPSGIQPPALDPSRIEGGKVLDGAAGVENVREGLKKILEGPDFNTGPKG
jgi:hypothetical protein